MIVVAVELISVEQLASRIDCTRQTVESHRRRGADHFATWTALKLGQPWRAIALMHSLRHEAILRGSPSISAIALASIIIGAILFKGFYRYKLAYFNLKIC